MYFFVIPFFNYLFCLISGKQTCYSGWKAEYTGFLMTEHKSHNNKEYACVDKDAEPIDSDTSNTDGAVFWSEDRVWQSEMSSIQG